MNKAKRSLLFLMVKIASRPDVTLGTWFMIVNVVQLLRHVPGSIICPVNWYLNEAYSRVSYFLVYYRHHLIQPYNMAPITKIEYFRVPPRWLFVKITDANENYGWGEASLEGHTEAVEGCLEAFAARFGGMDAK